MLHKMVTHTHRWWHWWWSFLLFLVGVEDTLFKSLMWCCLDFSFRPSADMLLYNKEALTWHVMPIFVSFGVLLLDTALWCAAKASGFHHLQCHVIFSEQTYMMPQPAKAIHDDRIWDSMLDFQDGASLDKLPFMMSSEKLQKKQDVHLSLYNTYDI